eukprot:CAMPEP_0198554014 /NCGR_PEP_ID=MMETSP1462-20131121/81634_1 /TAXON_ID=1333877 /ORGANISM="Brandtodinium nutriculum, Strain RCC3387" /LENGTH=45 /DNA_ID= /DNA_START= /DNA_END= /DNA_ORIENTATION=
MAKWALFAVDAAFRVEEGARLTNAPMVRRRTRAGRCNERAGAAGV